MNDPSTLIPLEIYETQRAMRRAFDARVRALGFTQGQWRALSLLGRNEGISQVRLAELLDMQPISLGRILDRMEGNGLIERRPDPNDRRALKLFLKPAAGPILEILRTIGEELRQIAMAGLSDAEQEVLFKVLRGMRQRLEAAGHMEPDPALVQGTGEHVMRPT